MRFSFKPVNDPHIDLEELEYIKKRLDFSSCQISRSVGFTTLRSFPIDSIDSYMYIIS